jgi:hypothetical protein
MMINPDLSYVPQKKIQKKKKKTNKQTMHVKEVVFVGGWNGLSFIYLILHDN